MILTHFNVGDRRVARSGPHAGWVRNLVLAAFVLCGFNHAALAQSVEWTRRVVPGPSPRSSLAMAYDPARGVTVLFGGYNNGVLGETWEWNGTTWNQRAVQGPSPRNGAAMVYDSARSVMVLFGGADAGGNYLGETWEWNGTSWLQRTPSGLTPPPRTFINMAYDSARGVTVLFGGWNNQVMGDMWEWNGTDWIQRFVTGPSSRAWHNMVFDSQRGVCVLYGGYSNSGENAETWEWNGTAWSQRLVSGPTRRYDHAMAYDSTHGVTVLFGGYNGGLLGDTWEWNGTSWAQRSVSALSPRHASGMTYDVARDVAVLFGGATSIYVGETWEIQTISRLYVNRQATGANTGANWNDAFHELRDALALAAAQPSIHEIWVAAGTYAPTTYTGPASRSESFNLQNNLAIYGGFAGTETSLAQRTPATIAANPTILSGDLEGDDNGDLNKRDNSYHVVVGSGTDPTAILDGVTITRGYADEYTSNDSRNAGGGGLFISAGAPSINDCNFTANAATFGGAMLTIHSSPTLTRCAFTSNKADRAISPLPTPYPSSGGAVVCDFGNTFFRSCTFSDNSANGVQGIGGACSLTDAGSPALVMCSFLRNAAGGSGGAVFGAGGSTLWIESCQFLGNRALRVGGVQPGGPHTIANSLFSGNIGDAGISAYGFGSIPFDGSIVNCVFAANFSGAGEGAVHFNGAGGASLTLVNSLLWGNTSPDGTLENAQYVQCCGTGAVIQRSTIQGWTGSLSGTGNNGLNPLFLRAPSPGLDGFWGTPDDDYGDLRLSPGSPAIDSGDSSAVPQDTYDIDADGNTTEAVPLDLAGFPRFVDDPSAPNTGSGSPPVDRGCYESQVNCTSCPGIREWRSSIGGNFNYAGNWFPSIPGQTHDTIFDLSTTYDVTFPTAAQLFAKSANIRRGDVLFDLGGSTWSLTSSLTPALQIGSDSPTLASLTVTGGTLQAFSALVGTNAESQGNLHITGTGSTLRVTNDMSIGFFGKGTALIDNGARLITRTAGVGDQPGSDGSYVRVTGPGSRWDVPFFLQINNGEVNVSNQASLNAGFGIFLFQNGTLSGDGTINGDVVNFGALRPGNSPGRLTINGSYEQVGVLPDLGASSGQLISEIAGTPASGNFDKLIVNGTAKLGGLLQVNLTGHTPTSSENYQLVTATGGIQGRFDVALFPSIGADKFLYATYPEAGTQVNLSVQPLSNDPNLSPQENRTVAGEPTAAALGDLNGDGLPDLAVTISNGEVDPGSVVIFLNLGGAGAGWQGFSQAQVIQIPVGIDPRGIVLAHLDEAPGSSGKLDIAVANAGSNSVSIIRNLGSNVYSLASTTTVGSRPVAICAFNLDGDTKVDLATANHDSDSISLLRGNGSGGISSNTLNSDGPPQPDTIEPIDPTTDKPGHGSAMNLAIGSRSGSSITLLRNNGSGAFAAMAPIAIGAGTSQILSRDLNGDGRADILTGNTDGSVSVILNTTTGNNPLVLAYQPAVNLPIEAATLEGDGVVSLTAFKADLDTDRDVAIAVRTGGVTHVRFLRNDLFAGNLAFTLRPDLVGSESNPIALVSSYVDDEPLTQDLVIVGSDGDGRPGGPGGPFGGRSVANVRPVLTGNLCPADFDGDGTVDFFDYDAFVACFEGGPCPNGKTADFDGDGSVDFFDYDGFVVAFEHGC